MTALDTASAPAATGRNDDRRRSPASVPAIAPTLAGMCAVLGGCLALVPLLIGWTWLVPTVEVIAVVWLVGVGARLIAVPAPAVGLLQLVALAITLTSVFLGSGFGGVIPGPAAVGEATDLLTAAWDQILTTVPPAEATTALEFLIALSVGIVALVVDILIAGTGTPALVALPLLSLYSVPASIAPDMLPWYAFVAPVAGYIGVLALTRRPGLPRPAAMTGRRAGAAVAIGAVAVVGSLVLADSATGIGTAGRIPRGTHGGDVGISPWALLRGDLRDNKPVDTLRVTGLDHPAYLRTFALEKWEPDHGFVLGAIRADDRDISGALPDAPAVSDDSETITVTAQHYRAKYLPIYLDTTSVGDLGHRWDYDRGLATVFRSDPVVPDQYTVTANLGEASAAELRTEDVRSSGPLVATGDIPDQVVTLARSLTANAASPFDAAEAILDYFTDPANGFTYSLTTKSGNSGSALLDFLTSKQGYCEQYAAAMAIMLRAVGIPTRVGIGFTQGTEQPDGSYQIESTNAHAWVEVRFDRSGWVAFDPTPPTRGQGGLQGFTEDSTPDDSTEPDDSTTETSGPSATQTTESTETTAVAPELGQIVPGTDSTDAAADESNGPGGAVVAWWGAALAVLILAALAAAPGYLRGRRRRRRLDLAARQADGSGSAAWQEIADTMVDHGLAPDPAESARSTADRAAEAAGLSGSDRAHLRAVVMAVESEWYGTSRGTGDPARGTDEPARGTADPARGTGGTVVAGRGELARGVRAVIDGMQRQRPLSLMARLFPRSMWRSDGPRADGRRGRA